MHPSFMAKLNPQHVRDSKGNVRWLVENPPVGTAKAIVHPVRETDAAAVAAAAPSSVAEPAVTASEGNVPLPRANPRRVTAVAAAGSQPASSGSMFNGLFASSASTVTSSFSNATTSVVRALGFGKEEQKPEPTRTGGGAAGCRANACARRRRPPPPSASARRRSRSRARRDRGRDAAVQADRGRDPAVQADRGRNPAGEARGGREPVVGRATGAAGRKFREPLQRLPLTVSGPPGAAAASLHRPGS